MLWWHHMDGLVQKRRNSIANALELHLFCTNPSTKSQPAGWRYILQSRFYNWVITEEHVELKYANKRVHKMKHDKHPEEISMNLKGKGYSQNDMLIFTSSSPSLEMSQAISSHRADHKLFLKFNWILMFIQYVCWSGDIIEMTDLKRYCLSYTIRGYLSISLSISMFYTPLWYDRLTYILMDKYRTPSKAQPLNFGNVLVI